MSKKNTKSFLEWMVSWGVLATLFIVPIIYFSSRFGGAVTSKQFFFMGAVDLLMIAWTWLLVTDQRYRFTQKTWYAIAPLTLFFGSAALSTLLSVDMAMSLYSSVARGIGFIFLTHVYLFSLIIVSVLQVQGKDFFKKIITTLFVTSVLVAISTFFTNEAIDIGSTWLNDTAGGGTLGNSSLAGGFLVFGVFIALIQYFLSEKKNEKIASLVGFFIIICSPIFINIKGLFVTQIAWTELGNNVLAVIGLARGAAIGVVLGLVTTGLVYGIFTAQRKWVKGIGIGIIGLGSIVAIIVSLKVVTPGTSLNQAFINNVGNNRLIFWQEAAQGIKERPLVGWGLENYRIVHNKYLDPNLLGKAYGFEVWTDKPHNIFVEVLVSQGIVGLILYIVVLGGIIGYSIVLVQRKTLPPIIGALIIGMITAYVIQNQLVFDSITSTVVFWSIAAMLMGLIITNEAQKSNVTQITTKGYLLGGVVSVTAITIWIFFVIIPTQKMVEAKKVFDAPIVTRVTKYEKLFSGFGARYLMTDLGVVSYGLAESFSNERQLIAAEPKHVAIALKEIEAFQQVVDDFEFYTQHDYRVRLAQAMLNEVELSMRGEYTKEEVDQMINRIEKTIELSPTNPLGYLVYGRTLVFADRIDDARAMLNKGIALNPNVKEAHDLLNAFEAFYGTPKQKREALENAQKHIPGYEYTPR